ncbi:MAG: cation-transporting P-type ATPase, partial [Nitrospirota bacterium]
RNLKIAEASRLGCQARCPAYFQVNDRRRTCSKGIVILMKIQNLSKEEVLKTLLTSERGLSEEDARRRLHEYGLNEIKEVRKKPLYLRLISQFTHFLAILLWIAAALCFLSEYLHPGEGMLSLGLAIVGVIVINAIFTFIQEYRAEKAVEALKRLLPFNVKVLRAGLMKEIPAREVVPGDVFLLSEGDKIPADARLIDENRLMVNNAPLTGESESKPRSHRPFEGEYLESPNIVFAGTLVVSGSGKAVAFATGMSTEFGKIAHLTSAVEPGLSPLQKEILKVTKIIAVIALTTGIFFFAIGTFTSRSFWHNFIFAVGIIIANVPEGLLPTVTLSLAIGSQRMAKKKALIKTLTSVETLGSVTVICTDKTGTLTQNKMEVEKIWTIGGQGSSVNMLMKIAYLCNNAVYERGKYTGDPTEIAILKKARETSGDVKAERIYEIPFDSDRKRMTTVNVIDNETFVLTKGALETVLPLCNGILKDNEIKTLSEESKDALTQAYHSMMDEGLRVIAFAFACKKGITPSAKSLTDSSFESDLTFVGLMGLEDPPRPEVPLAIKKCREAGIKVIMITGDASRTAAAIAKQIGLTGDNPTLIEGPEMDIKTDSSIRETLRSGEIIFARMSPRHKMRIVSILKDERERVAVTGDGVNDAPALKRADIGISMGIMGTDVAREAADMVLLDDNFATIVNAVEEGRTVFENIKKFITYIFAHLTPEAIPYILFSLFRIPLPLTVMQILAIDLGTETIPALALGAEPPEATMKRSSSFKGSALQEKSERKGIIDRFLLFRGYIFIGLIGTVGVLFVYFSVLYQGGWQWGMDLPANSLLGRHASTATFLGIVIMQIGNVFACRSSRESIFRLGFFSNKLITIGIVVEVILSAFIIYHPFGNKIFGTAPLSLNVWLILIPFSAGLLAAEEIRKLYVRKFSQRIP